MTYPVDIRRPLDDLRRVAFERAPSRADDVDAFAHECLATMDRILRSIVAADDLHRSRPWTMRRLRPGIARLKEDLDRLNALREPDWGRLPEKVRRIWRRIEPATWEVADVAEEASRQLERRFLRLDRRARRVEDLEWDGRRRYVERARRYLRRVDDLPERGTDDLSSVNHRATRVGSGH